MTKQEQSSSPPLNPDGSGAPSSLLAEFIVIALMPMLYGAATRLPFMYFVIHLSGHFSIEWLDIGLSVAAFQGSRIVPSALAIHFPIMSHVFGTTVGLVGYLIVLVSDKDSLVPFIVGTAMVGMSETMSSMQKYAKEMYKHHPDGKVTRLRMKFQYAFVMIGVMLGFLIGGFTYQYLGITGVAVCGIILEGLGLIALFAFLLLKRQSVYENILSYAENNFPIKLPNSMSADEEEKKKEMVLLDPEEPHVICGLRTSDDKHPTNQEASLLVSNRESTGGVVKLENVPEEDYLPSKDPDETQKDIIDDNSSTSTTSTSMFESINKMINRANLTYAASDLPATWINWFLCLTFGVEALTIGYTLGIGPMFILTEFQKGADIIGIVFSAGAAFGTISAILVTCTSFGNDLLRKLAAPPLDLCFAMGGIAMGVFIACVPNFAVHAIGIITLMCFNDLGATIMTELQSSVTTVKNFSLLGPLGQVIRRSLNVATALTGPILFGINPRFPYYVAGSTTLCWTILFFILFKLRMKKIVKVISHNTGRNRKSIKSRMSFATSEQVYSMAET